MSLVSGVASAAVGLLTAATNLLTDAFLTPPVQASLAHLEEAELRPLSSGESSLGAGSESEPNGTERTVSSRLAAAEGQKSVGGDWSCRHGRAETRMISVQRGE